MHRLAMICFDFPRGNWRPTQGCRRSTQFTLYLIRRQAQSSPVITPCLSNGRQSASDRLCQPECNPDSLMSAGRYLGSRCASLVKSAFGAPVPISAGIYQSRKGWVPIFRPLGYRNLHTLKLKMISPCLAANARELPESLAKEIS
jgi:hypothetical protein